MVKSSEVLKLLKAGKSVKEITKITGAKIAAIKAHEKRLIQKQLWHSKDSGLQWELDFNGATEFLIDRLEKAKSVPELMEKINQLEKQKVALENELHSIRKMIDEKMDRERRYYQALQSGYINPPISLNK